MKNPLAIGIRPIFVLLFMVVNFMNVAILSANAQNKISNHIFVENSDNHDSHQGHDNHNSHQQKQKSSSSQK